jgi:hypothetical protein
MRQMGPLNEQHPLVRNDSTTCAACHEAFLAGDYVTLVMVGTGRDRDAQEKRDSGRPYNGVALPVHWECRP